MLLIIEFLPACRILRMAADRIQYHMCHTVHGSYSSSVKRTKRENIFRDFIYNDWNVFALILFLITSAMIHVDGFSSADAEGLILMHEETGLQIKDVLFWGVVISSLGAIMDVGMSVVSSLYEIYHHNPTLTAKRYFQIRYIDIGKDVHGTMKTAPFPFGYGLCKNLILVFLSFQVQFNQLINSNYLSIEIALGTMRNIREIFLKIPKFLHSLLLLCLKNKKMLSWGGVRALPAIIHIKN